MEINGKILLKKVIKMSTVKFFYFETLIIFSEISNYLNNGQNEADELDFSVNIRQVYL